MNILVTGGAGYIGSHTCKELKAAGFNPVVYDNLSRGHGWAVKWGPLVKGDLKETEKIVKAFKDHKIQAVIHFAAYAYVGESVQNPGMYYDNNVHGSLSLFKAMQSAQISKIVFSSSCATYGMPQKMPITEQETQKPINPYGQSKKMVEQILKDAQKSQGFEPICLRYFNAAGASLDGDIGEHHEPETHLIPLTLLTALGKHPQLSIFGNDYPTADGTCIRDYIHVCDLASAHVLALKKLFDHTPMQFAYNLGTGHGYSVKQVHETAEKITGKNIPVSFAPRREGDPAILVADTQAFHKDYGWKAKYSDLPTLISSAWNWTQKHF